MARSDDEGFENVKDRQFVVALARGLDILRCFTPATPELGTSQIARMVRLPQPTVWRLCHTLLELGYLVAIPSRQTMRPGIPLLALGQAVLSGQPIGELALPHMQAIASRHEGAVSLGARDGIRMIYLQRCQGSAIVFAELRIGSHVPMATSATGWAYLAGLGKAERKAVLAELRADLGDQWPKVEERLLPALDDYEQTGYVINKGSLHAQINSVAVPVKSPDGSALLALSSGGIAPVFTSERLGAIGVELKGLAAKLAPLLTLQNIG
ncbi:MAG TPA: IclR family transcriptional regulator [Stellaceae bacterium]|nr:IclR family transcriptional regulator [Stellaceae bacterium]